MTCSDLEAALRGICDHVYRDAAPTALTEYIVWSIYSCSVIHGDNHGIMVVPRVQIDAYTQSPTAEEAGGIFQKIIELVNQLNLAYEIADVGFDDSTASRRMILQISAA